MPALFPSIAKYPTDAWIIAIKKWPTIHKYFLPNFLTEMMPIHADIKVKTPIRYVAYLGVKLL